MVTEKQIKLARDKFKEISGITIYTPDEGTLDDFWQSRYDGLVAAIEAGLSAADLQPTPSVAVKALEWRPGAHGRKTASVFGRLMYEVGIDKGEWYWLHNWEGLALRRVDSESEAKASAQADYETRIRSALSAHVQDEAGWILVPVDATDKMIAAALNVDWSNENENAAVHNIWHSMLVAAAEKQEG